MAKKNDKGMEELLDLLKACPELINAIVFYPDSLKKMIKVKGARELLARPDVDELLREVSEAEQKGVRMVVCLDHRTVHCRGGVTGYNLQCYRSTGPA